MANDNIETAEAVKAAMLLSESKGDAADEEQRARAEETLGQWRSQLPQADEEDLTASNCNIE